jgi:hypothetical protein
MHALKSRLRLLPTVLALVVGPFLGAACGDDDGSSGAGGSGASGTSSGSGASGSLPEPASHRAEAASCTGEPPAGNAVPDAMAECETDADCTEGANGRCIWPNGGTNECRYDECTQDVDCGGVSVCACRVEDQFGFNRCYQGNCVVDADCGSGGWCSPSAVHVSPSCMEGISPGSVGYFCRTADDECLNDEDCGSDGACLFDVDALHWVCHELLCAL